MMYVTVGTSCLLASTWLLSYSVCADRNSSRVSCAASGVESACLASLTHDRIQEWLNDMHWGLLYNHFTVQTDWTQQNDNLPALLSLSLSLSLSLTWSTVTYIWCRYVAVNISFLWPTNHFKDLSLVTLDSLKGRTHRPHTVCTSRTKLYFRSALDFEASITN